jgi:hypothetical protein
VSEQPKESAAELLAEWRAAGRDTVAAHAAAKVAELALEAATAAEEAANEVEAAAKIAHEAIEKARSAAGRAREAAAHAAEAAHLAIGSAVEDKAHANHDVEVAEQAETEARDAFHRGENAAFDKAERKDLAEP